VIHESVPPINPFFVHELLIGKIDGIFSGADTYDWGKIFKLKLIARLLRLFYMVFDGGF